MRYPNTLTHNIMGSRDKYFINENYTMICHNLLDAGIH